MRSCNLHSFLTSTQQDVLLDRGNSRTVHRTISLVRLQELESFSVEQFGSGVFGGSYQHGPIFGELKILDEVVVTVVHSQPFTWE